MNGNPVSFIDPFGLSKDPALSVWGGELPTVKDIKDFGGLTGKFANVYEAVMYASSGVGNYKDRSYKDAQRDYENLKRSIKDLKKVDVSTFIPGTKQIKRLDLQFFASKGTGNIRNLAKNYKLDSKRYSNHIVDRHGPNSKYSNKSKFNADFNIKQGINQALTSSKSVIKKNTNGRDGYIFEYTYPNSIGTDNKDKPINTIKVVIDKDGNVVTAYPKK